MPSIRGDHRDRSAGRPNHNVEPNRFVVGQTLGLDLRSRTQQSHTTTRQDALFDSRTRGVQGVFNASLLLLHLAFGGGTDVDLCHAAGELCQPLFELLTVVVAGDIFDLATNLLDATLDLRILAGSLDDRGVVFVDNHLLGTAEFGQAKAFELHA